MEQPCGEQPALLPDQLPGGGCHDDFRCRVSGVPLPAGDRGQHRAGSGCKIPGCGNALRAGLLIIASGQTRGHLFAGRGHCNLGSFFFSAPRAEA